MKQHRIFLHCEQALYYTSTNERTRKALINGPHTSFLKIVLAHGAGVPMDSFFMKRIARGLADNGFSVVRFEFPYMQRMRQTGKRRR